MHDGAVQWSDMLGLLQWIIGAIATMVFTLVAAAISVIWAGGRWTQRIESAMRTQQIVNIAQHRFMWRALRLLHPDHPEFPDTLPGDGNGHGGGDL
jgi:hypothetical protein